LTSLLRAPELVAVLVGALEQEKLVVADLDPATRELLRRLPNADLQRRLQRFLGKEQASDRQAVVRKYQAALDKTGDRQRGAALFAAHCLTCHSLQGQGHQVGPDLSGVASRPKAQLIEDLLDPSKEVAPDFIAYVLLTKRGQVLTGLLVAETGTSVKLRRAEAAEDTVLRSEIQELRATGKSLMPEGLEQTLSIQDVADVLEFLLRPVPLPPPGGKGR
jgi:putative heme-binding domain-containing protein